MRFRLLIPLLLTLAAPTLASTAAPSSGRFCVAPLVRRIATTVIPPAQWEKEIRDAYRVARTAMRKPRHVGGFLEMDTGAEMAARLRRGDDHAKQLIALGSRIEQDADGVERLLLPEDPFELFRRALVRVPVSEDSIHAAVMFLRRGAEDIESTNLRFVRPGIDEWPDPEHWILQTDLPQLDHEIWEEAMAAGKMPMGLKTFIEHDLGHLTEFVSDADLMKATRAFYREAAARPAWWRRSLETPSETARRHYERVIAFAEAGSLPSLARAEEIRALVPDRFGPNPPRSLGEAVSALSRMEDDALTRRARRLVDSRDTVLIRQGGNNRDSYNLPLEASEDAFFAPMGQAIRKGKWPPLSDRHFTGLRAARESLHGLALEIERLLHPETVRSPGWKTMLADRVARFETALAEGVKLGLTPAQVVRDAGAMRVDFASPTYRFFSSFAREDGYLWHAFLSPAATGRAKTPPSGF